MKFEITQMLEWNYIFLFDVKKKQKKIVPNMGGMEHEG